MTRNNISIERLLSDDSFIRWIEGRATAKENSEWNTWLEEDPARRDLVEEAYRLHTGFRFKHATSSETESELLLLNRAIDQFELQKHQPKKTLFLGRKRSYWFPRAAAVIAILIMVLSLSHFLYPEMEVPEETSISVLSTTQTNFGERKRLVLSDGSVIVLNANSSLTYPSTFSEGNLEVYLDGEAWFEISPEADERVRTFSVHTRDGRVEVLGTKFNVNTWRNQSEVVLQEGKILVELKGNLDQLNDSHIMTPGESARFTLGGEAIQISRIDTEAYTSWVQGRLTFNQMPLSVVAERIEDIYGIRFSNEQAEIDLDEIKISGSLPNDNLQVFLNAFEGILERQVNLIDGVVHFGPEEEI